ncbi:MAG: DNA-directed RNA polymerase subunit omega [Clostridia bacterium]|nr:DNA-directed RNA polymerase subunit omega [Clostridia bacterium]MBR5427636.1 DNA-directed RNA polymerase subunit omega [Clostridia bacterium]
MMSPDLDRLLEGGISRYSLVAAVSKRAREIVDAANAENEIIEEKPISTAVDELLEKKYRIVEKYDED